jgi:hypothetical protein
MAENSAIESKPVKAYQVDDDHSGHSVVVFADRSVVARKRGANELDLEFGEVSSCRRKPQYDAFASQGYVPIDVLIDDGWWFECPHCGHRITSDGASRYYDHEEEHDLPVYTTRDAAYCDIHCYEADKREWLLARRREQALADRFHELYPGATVIWVNEYEKDARVVFRFPGGARNVEWKGKTDLLYIDEQDLPAWEAFTGKPFVRVGMEGRNGA